MGPEDKNTYTLYLGDTPIAPVTPGEIPEITLPVEAQEPEKVTWRQPMEFTMHIETLKHWRRGNRKRFVKLMMSEGISRNYAERLAAFTRTLMPYREAWVRYILHEIWKGSSL